jgi:predicted transport protein
MVANFKEKTGKTLEEWVKRVKASGLDKHGQIVAWLKSEHGMGHGFANLVAHTASGLVDADGDDLLEAQYAGPKAALRPLYNTIASYAQRLGADVEIAPKKTSVSFRRSKQFACATPATKSRIDLGIQLKGAPANSRLQELKAGSMTSHNVKLDSLEDFDDELKAWLKQAYERA